MVKATKKESYTVVFRPEPEGGFTVYVPLLPGCISYGKTLPEAQQMIRDAIEGYLFVMRKHGEKIPSDTESFIGTVAYA